MVLQACLCSWCLPLQADAHDEAQSVLKSRMQDQASEQSCNIKARKETSTPPPSNNYCVNKTHVELWKYFFFIPSMCLLFFFKYLWISKQKKTRAVSVARQPWRAIKITKENSFWITRGTVFCSAVVSWTSVLAWATWSQTVQTIICPQGLTHFQPLHQILQSTYPISSIIVLKSLFWPRYKLGTLQDL